jgi:aerobic-type carbon monoxide dehydrogenase small subunit (CoxS/CutS family)
MICSADEVAAAVASSTTLVDALHAAAALSGREGCGQCGGRNCMLEGSCLESYAAVFEAWKKDK